MIMGDSFSINVFKDSFRKVFDCDENGYLQMGFNAQIKICCSRDFKCKGAVGGLASAGKHGPSVSNTEVGESKTYQWFTGSLDRKKSIGFYFEILNKSADAMPQGKQAFLQFQTVFFDPS